MPSWACKFVVDANVMEGEVRAAEDTRTGAGTVIRAEAHDLAGGSQ